MAMILDNWTLTHLRKWREKNWINEILRIWTLHVGFLLSATHTKWIISFLFSLLFSYLCFFFCIWQGTVNHVHITNIFVLPNGQRINFMNCEELRLQNLFICSFVCLKWLSLMKIWVRVTSSKWNSLVVSSLKKKSFHRISFSNNNFRILKNNNFNTNRVSLP